MCKGSGGEGGEGGRWIQMIPALHHNFLLGCALSCMTRKCFDCVVCAFTVLACCTFHFCFLSWFRMIGLY